MRRRFLIAPAAGRTARFPDGRPLAEPTEAEWSPWWARRFADGDITRRPIGRDGKRKSSSSHFKAGSQ